jgi:TP901 family phage tail tape measure protein
MADVNATVGLKIKATDESKALIDKAEKSVKDLDKTLKDSARVSAAAGKSAKKGAEGYTELGDSAETASEKVTTSANSSKKSLKEINHAWDLLGSKSTKTYRQELKRVEAAFERIKNSGKASAEDIKRAQTALIAKQKELNAAIKGEENAVNTKKTAEKLEATGKAVNKLLGLLAKLAIASGIVIVPVVQTAKFNRSMAEVRGVLGDVTDNEFEDLTDVARQLGATTEFSAQQAADGLKFLAQAGFTAFESMEALPGVLNLAQAGNVGLGEAADIASNILTGMALPVSELGRVNDVLVQGFTSTNTSLSELGYAFSYVAPIAAGFGVSVEETTAAIGLLSNAGIKASTAGTTLRGILTKLAAPGEKAAGIMADVAKRIGQTSIEILDSNGKFLSLSKVIGQFEKAGLTASEAISILGQRAGPGLVALVSQGSKAFDALNDKLLDSAGRADAVAKIMRDTLVGDFKSAQSAVSELALSIGDQLIPAARWLVQIFSDLVTWSSDLVKAYPTLVPLVVGLAGAFAALAVAINSIGVAKTLGPLVATNWAAGIAGVKAFTASIVTGFTAAKTAVLSFAASNPILLAVIAVLAVATTAYAIFGESAEDAAEKHRKNAEAIGESRRQLTDEVRELERIKEILSEEIPGSEKFVKAQERMAELLPGVNVYLDEQGRVLAKVGDKGEDAAEGLDKYIDQLKGEEQLAFIDQLEQQEKAYAAASKGSVQLAKHMKDRFARGEDEASLWQRFNKSVAVTIGGYRRFINTGKELRESTKKSGVELDKLLGQALRSGLSIGELTDALSKNQAGTEESSAIIARYTKLVENTAEAHRQAAEEARRTGKATLDSYAEPIQTVKELKAELTSLKKVSSELGKEIKSENKIVSDSLKGLKDDYKVLGDAVKSRADSELQAIEDVKQARLRGAEGLTEGRQIAEVTRILQDAYASRISAIQTFTQESESLFREEEEARRSLAESGAGNVAQIEVDILNKRRGFYQETIGDYRSMISEMIAEENRHLDVIRKIEEEKHLSKLNTEDKIRELRNKGLSEEKQYADKLRQIDEKQSAAKKALAEEDFAEAKRLNEQARSLAGQSIRTDSAGKAAAASSVEKTIEELKESEKIGQAILDQMLQDHQDAAGQMASEREKLQVGLQDVEQKLVELNTQLQEMSSSEIEIQIDQVDAAIEKVNELSAALDEIDGKISRSTVIITERTVAARAAGGPVGVFKKLMSPVIRAGGGKIDDVPAMLKREEFVMNPKATRKYGMGFMHLVNSGRFSMDAVPHLATGGVVLPNVQQMVAAPVPRGILQAAPDINFPDLGVVNLNDGERTMNVFVPRGNMDTFKTMVQQDTAKTLRGAGLKGPGKMPW